MSGYRPFGDDPLSRFGAFVYTLLTVEGLLLLTTAPGVVALVALSRDVANLPLSMACVLPVGPAVSAALVALDQPREPADLHPAATFRHAYRANLRAVLIVWVPLLAVLTVLGTSLTHLSAARIPGWWAAALVGIALLSVLWGLNALVLVSFFSFRSRDVARLAAYFLIRAPGVTVASTCVLVVAVGVVVMSSEAMLVLLGSMMTVLLLGAQRPLIRETGREFIR